MDNRKVADAYWGLQPQGQPPPVADVANLGPPPRELTPAAAKYLRTAVRSFTGLFLTLAIVCALPLALVPVGGEPIGSLVSMIVLPLLFAGLAIWSRMRTRERRDQLRFVLTEGQLLSARILSIHTREVRRNGRVVQVRYHVRFDLEGRAIELVSFQPALAMLQVGLIQPVVWHPNAPDVVVPAFLLA